MINIDSEIAMAADSAIGLFTQQMEEKWKEVAHFSVMVEHALFNTALDIYEERG